MGSSTVLVDARHAVGNQPSDVVPIGGWARYDRPARTFATHDQLLTGSEG